MANNLLVDWLNKKKNNVQTNVLRKSATNTNNVTTPNLPIKPTAVSQTGLNLQKAQQPVQTRLNTVNSQTTPVGIQSNNPAFNNGALVNQNNQPSRFIGFQQPKLNTDLAGNIVNQEGNVLNTAQKGKSWATEMSKPVLNIPTQSGKISDYNTKQEKTYRDNEQVIKDFHYDVQKFGGMMNKEQISQLYPEFKGKEDIALMLQADILPLVQNNEFADMKKLSELYPELLPKQQSIDAGKYKKEQETQENNMKFLKQRADKLLATKNTLSDEGKKYLQDMSQLAEFTQYIRDNYRLAGEPTDIDILNYAKDNFPEVKQIFDELGSIKLSGMDKAAIGGKSKNPFQNILAEVQEGLNDISTAYQENVAQPLTQMIESGELARRIGNTGIFNASTSDTLARASQIPVNMGGSILEGANKLNTAYTRVSQGQDRGLDQVAQDVIHGGGGAIDIAFNATPLALATAVFEAANLTDAGQQITENTLGLFQEGITNILDGTFAESLGGSKDTYLASWYNSLDEETKSELTNEITIAVLHKGGKALKNLKIEGGVAVDAITNAFERGKGAAMFQAWIEKGLAGEGKATKGAVSRIFKEGMSEFKDALKENFRLYDTVVKNRRGDITSNMNTLPDNRTFREKAESKFNQAKETVNEGVNTVKEGVNNAIDTAKQGVNRGVDLAKQGVETVKNKVTARKTTEVKPVEESAGWSQPKEGVVSKVVGGVAKIGSKVYDTVVEPVATKGAEIITSTTNAQDKLFKAVSPTLNKLTNKRGNYEQKRQNADRTNELIVEYGNVPENTTEYYNALIRTKQALWKNEIKRGLDEHKYTEVDAKEITNAVREAMSDDAKYPLETNKADIELLNRELAALDDIGQLSLERLEAIKQQINAKVNYGKNPTAGEVYEKGLRELNKKISEIEDQMISELPGEFTKFKKDYGALKDMEEDVLKMMLKDMKKKDGGGLIQNRGRIEGLGKLTSKPIEGILQFFLGESLGKAKDVNFNIKTGFEQLKNEYKGKKKTLNVKGKDEGETKSDSPKEPTPKTPTENTPTEKVEETAPKKKSESKPKNKVTSKKSEVTEKKTEVKEEKKAEQPKEEKQLETKVETKSKVTGKKVTKKSFTEMNLKEKGDWLRKKRNDGANNGDRSFYNDVVVNGVNIGKATAQEVETLLNNALKEGYKFPKGDVEKFEVSEYGSVDLYGVTPYINGKAESKSTLDAILVYGAYYDKNGNPIDYKNDYSNGLIAFYEGKGQPKGSITLKQSEPKKDIKEKIKEATGDTYKDEYEELSKGKKLYRGETYGNNSQVFWTDDKDIADSFGDTTISEKSIIMNNPLDVRLPAVKKLLQEEIPGINIDSATSAYKPNIEEKKKLMNWAEENGYDGIIGETSDLGQNYVGNEYIVLNDNQVNAKPKNKVTAKKAEATAPKQETRPQDSGRITAPKKERQIIKNDKGENEIVYHGTNAKFDKFDKNFIGRGGGFRFTTSKGEAETYGKNVKKYNLMASNILDADADNWTDLADSLIKQYTREKFGKEFYISPEAFIQDEGLRNYVQELGYDALKFSKGGDTKYIVYNEDQIIPVQKQPKAKATKTSKNKITNPSKAKTTSLFNENEVDKGKQPEGLNPDALPLSDYREMQRLNDSEWYPLGRYLRHGEFKGYLSTKIATELVGDYDKIVADEFDPEYKEDEWIETAGTAEEMYDAYDEYLSMKDGDYSEKDLQQVLDTANGYADELVKGKTAKELIDKYRPDYDSDLKIFNRLSKKYPGFYEGKMDLTGEQGRAMREFAGLENETAQDIDYQELAEIENQTPQDIDYQDLAELENETPQIVDVDEGVDITTQLIDEFNNLKPGEFKWIGDNREAGVRKTFGDANIKVPGEEDSVDIYFMPGDSGDRMNINLHDTSNLGIRNANEILSKLDIQYRIGSELDERNETKYFLENKLTHSKSYFDKNGASWLSVNKTLRGKEIVPRRNAEEQAEYNMQMEQRRAEIEAEREQDRIKAEERKAEEERQQEIDKQMKANLLRYVDIKHNDNPLGRGRTLKDLSEKNSEANNRIRYYGDDVADDAGVWQVLDVLADKNGKIREVWESDSKSSYSYEYYDEELGRNNNISGLNKTQRDYLEYRIKASQTEKRVNNHLDKIENKSLKTRVENKLNEMKKRQDDNGKTQYGTDAQYIDYLVLDKGFTPKEFPTGKTYANGEPKIDYMIVNEKNVGYISSKIENDYAKSLLETPEEELSAEDEAKLDELFTPKTTTEVTGEKNAVTAKQAESEKPKNLVTSRIENTKQEIQEIDKDTYFDDIVKNLKDHPREMFIYKDGNYFYPHYILPSGKVITPENTYWGEVSSEEAARNWLLKEAEEHSEENETKKAEKLKEIVGKTAEKYEATLKRIESDNPMQEIWTSGDYFKYGTSNSQMAKAKKESEANAEVGTFKKDVIDGKEGYRIFVAGTKNEAIRAFYEPKTGKTYRIYRGPIIDGSKPYTTKQVERIEKFLQNVDKQLDKETKREKPQEKTYITQEWLDGLKPDNDGVIELDSKGNESFALRKGKETLIKEGKADGKYIENYGGERSPQYLAFYIKDGVVYEGRKGLEDQYMKTKQEAVDWLNQKEKDVEHESTERYTQTDYETLPKTISVESEAEKAGPKRIAPDRVKRQQETYDQGLESVKNVLKQSPVKIYELGFKSDRSKAVQNILEERKRIRQLPETEAEKQWNELAKSVYEDLVIKDISKGYRYPEDVTSKFPKAQMKKAVDARARYEKGLFTSFSAKDTRANNQYRDEIGAGIKSQDGKPVTQEQMNEIVDGIRSFGSVFGLNMKKFAEDNNIIYVHLHGGNPFLMGGGGKARGGGMNIAGLYRRGADGNISISLGGVELVMEKGEDGEMKKNNVNATPEHELAHAVDYMLENKLFSSQDIEILKKTMNKPTRLINYYNRSQEIVARAVEQYAANKTGKSRYGKPYISSQAYWDQENFDKYVKPIVEKNMKEKMKDYMLENTRKNVLANDKNKITSK